MLAVKERGNSSGIIVDRYWARTRVLISLPPLRARTRALTLPATWPVLVQALLPWPLVLPWVQALLPWLLA